MPKLVLFEDAGFKDLLPLVYWRSVFELRLGRIILLDRIAQRLERSVSGVWTRPWIAHVAADRCGAPANEPLSGDALLVNGRWVCPRNVDVPPAPCVGEVDGDVAFVHCDARLASALHPQTPLDPGALRDVLRDVPRAPAAGWLIAHPWDLVVHADEALRDDFRPGDAGLDAPLPDGVLTGPGDVLHVGTRAVIHPRAVIDTRSGAVFIGEQVEISAHAVVQGPAYVGPGSRINPHAWLHGANSIGPVCRIGGEVDACVILGHSNKPHAGFLGHACVGSWVNLGAGTNNSDLKNTYGSVRVPICGVEVDTGLTFFGCVIGDHVKTAIGTRLPTGAVLGMAAVLASSRIVDKFVPSFTWLTDAGTARGDPERLVAVAETVMARRGASPTDAERELFLTLRDRAATLES